jgi:PAS domain S-box-containing protein
MKHSYDILLLEDNKSDAELIEIQLTKLDIAFELTLIDTEEELAEVLADGCPDIVISDYKLPGYTGSEALAFVHAQCPKLPFILVSGYVDPQQAVQVMVEGAADYVLKDNLDRLGPAVEREILNYQEHQRQERLLEASYDLADIGHWEFNVEDENLFWSPQVKQLHEVTQDFVPDFESTLSFFKNEGNKQKITALVEEAIEYGTGYTVELPIVTAKGNDRWLRIVADTVKQNGKVVRLFGSKQDITSRKRSEQQLLETKNKLRDIVEHSTNLFYRHDTDFTLTYVSPQAEHFFGCSQEQALRDWTDFTTDHPQNKKGIALTHEAIATGESPPPYEMQIKSLDGETRWVQVNEAPIVEDGQTVAMVGALTDITALKKSHNKQQMLAMVASETQNIVIITDTDDCIEWVNEAFTEITGYTEEEVLGKNPGDLLQGERTDPETVKRLSEKFDTGEPYSEEVLNYTKDGEPYWIKMDVKPIRNDQEEIERYFAIQEDITDRKRRVQELEEHARRLQWSQEIGDIGDWKFDLESQSVFWSDTMYTLYDRDPAKGPPSYEELMEYYPDQEERQDHMEKVEQALEKGTSYSFDITMKTDQGNIKYLHVEGFTSPDDGEVTQLMGIVQDITERKSVELELRQKERQLRSIIDNISGLFQRYKLNSDGADEYEYVSKGIEHLHEVSQAEVNSDPEIIWRQVIEEDKEGLRSSIRNSAKDLSEWNHKWRIITPSGKLKWIHGRGTPYKLEDGSVVWDAIKIDVTEQEQAIREREELYHLLEDSLNEVYVFDKDSLKFRYVNQGVTENTQYSIEQLREMTPLDLKPEYSKTQFLQLLSGLEGEDGQLYFETRHQRADGSFYPVEVYVTRDTYRDHEVYVANVLDISEKQKADRRLRMLLETAPIPIFIESKDGVIIDLWNEAAEEVTGFTKEEALNKRLPHVQKEQLDTYHSLKEEILDGHKIKGEEIMRTRKDGSEFPARLNASPLFDESDEIDSILVTLEDITEEKQLEKQLRDQVAFASSIIDSLPGLFYMMDADLNFVRLNKNVYELFNIDEQQLSELDPLSLIAPRERDNIKQNIREVMETGYSETESVMLVNGKDRHFYINGRLIELDGNKYLLGNGIDIHDRVTTQKDNEVLLKEVHHRVKNNLAIISGLLMLEMQNSEHAELEMPLQRSINRIQSMAKIHELLYNSSHFSSINLEKYLGKITTIVEETLGRKNKGVDITLNVDDIEANINTGIPLGMLINELLTNSFKYAFDNRKGEITITVHQKEPHFEVVYTDNGKGIEGNFDLSESSTLGMRIVHTLLMQLQADFELNTNGRFELVFQFKELQTGSHGNI